MIERLAASLRHVGPKIVGALEQRDVIRMLEVRLANQPSAPVRAAAVVTGGKAIDSHHFQASSRALLQRGTADATDSQHDDVERRIRHAVLALDSLRKNRRRNVWQASQLCQDCFNDLAADIGQPKIAAGMTKCEPLMIESQKSEDGRLQIVNVHGL